MKQLIIPIFALGILFLTFTFHSNKTSSELLQELKDIKFTNGDTSEYVNRPLLPTPPLG